jgi:hypothetical protein
MNSAELFALKHEKYLIAAYSPLCRTAGYENVDALIGVDCYALATQIMSAVKHRARYIVKGSFGETDYLGALRSMTATELREMRSRINFRPLRHK